MIILFVILIRNIIHIIIIDYCSFIIRIESLDWIPYIFRIPLHCTRLYMIVIILKIMNNIL